MKLRNILIAERLKKEWTQEKMAKEIGISLVTYINLESGKEECSMLTKGKVANYLGIDISMIE